MNNEFSQEKVRERYTKLTRALIEKSITVSTMESITSGQIASLITDTEGSSAVFKGGFVTYCNEAKVQNGVKKEIIEKYGVYSHETAKAMANACSDKFGTDLGIGITGSAGNVDPNNGDSIPGNCFFAISYKGKTESFNISIPNFETRLQYKLYVADSIAEEIFKIIDK
ncbi:MAG: CinA family protein [Lachnospiraceae bacterium]|nr:CinA family protein [Lachnospiraceae bacterium]